MSELFISHSSRDAQTAAELRRRLDDHHFKSVFLDFDPEVGIPAGKDWEQELYRQLRGCRAVVVLCSRHSMKSLWCFAEIAHARSLGKEIFPLRLDDCTVHSVLATRQMVDLTGGNGDKDAAYGRLLAALRAAGLGESFRWSKARSPYPGLLSFEAEDAAIFCGRGAEIDHGLETLERLRRFGGVRALLVLGASGVGKSSLLKAGLLPRLDRKRQEWLVLPPFRPGDDPWRQLAVAFARAFRAAGEDRDWRRTRGELVRAALVPGRAARALVELAVDLRERSERPATVLVVVDQLEELLAEPRGARGGDGFLAALRGALETPASPLMALCTLRSDLLGRLLHHPAGLDFQFADLPVGPLTPEGLMQVVEGPAMAHGLELEPGLADAVVADAGGQDALPLLAFTLRELYERFGRHHQRLTIEDYRRGLGGLDGSVARAAEGVLAEAPLAAGELEQVREAFLAMVRIDDEGGYARRSALWSELPRGAREPLERFRAARLLTTRDDGAGRRLEVAHEALFRSWQRLGRWLDRDRELLLWQRRLEQAVQRWQQTGRRRRALLAGPELEEARVWLARGAARLPPDAREYVAESVRDAARRRRLRTLSAAATAVVLALVAAAGLTLWRRAEDARGRAKDAARVALAGEWMARDPTVAALVLLEVERPEETALTTVKMRQALGLGQFEVELAGHRDQVAAVDFAAGGERVVTASFDGTARIWDRGSGAFVELDGHRDNVERAELSPDGKWALTLSERGDLRLFRADGLGEPRLLADGRDRADSAHFGPRGERIVATYTNGKVRVWNVDRSGEPWRLDPEAGVVLGGARLTPRGDRLLTVATDGTVELWSGGGGERLARGPADLLFVAFSPPADRLLAVSDTGRGWVGFPHGQGEPLWLDGLEGEPLAACFEPGGERLASAGEDGAVHVWSLSAAGPAPRLLRGHRAAVTAADFDATCDLLITGSEDRTARVWDLAGGDAPLILRGHLGPVTAVALDHTGKRALSASSDGATRVWTVEPSPATAVHRGHRAEVVAASFDLRGERIVTASTDGTARVARADGSGHSIELAGHSGGVTFAAFDPASERVLTASADGTARIWRADGAGAPIVLDGHGGVVETAAWDPRGERVATGASDGLVRLWPAGGSRPAQRLEGHQDLVMEVAFSPDGDSLLTASLDASARVWRLDGSAASVTLTGHEDGVLAAAFSADGRRVVTASADGTARVWRADGNLEAVLRGHRHDVVMARFDPAGERVVTASADGTARIWLAGGAGAPIVLDGHRGRLTAAAFDPGGTRVVTASADGTARVWRADGVGEPMILEHGQRVTAAAFSAGGRRLLTASEDGTARVWSIAAEDLAHAIAGRVGSCLEPAFRRASLSETASEAQRAFDACQRARGRG